MRDSDDYRPLPPNGGLPALDEYDMRDGSTHPIDDTPGPVGAVVGGGLGAAVGLVVGGPVGAVVGGGLGAVAGAIAASASDDGPGAVIDDEIDRTVSRAAVGYWTLPDDRPPETIPPDDIDRDLPAGSTR
jgi:hypothetical protein